MIKPLMGTKQQAPCDAAVITPVYGETTGLAISNGLNPRMSSHDCHLMAICAADEAIRNAVCVGADPATITLLDNFCWPDPIVSSKNPRGKLILAQLVRACQGLHEVVMAFQTPLISGKDSMKNDFDDGVLRLSIPPTLLVSAMGKVHDINACVSMEFKQAGDLVYLLNASIPGLAGSHYEEMAGWQSPITPKPNLSKAARMYKILHKAINCGFVNSAHDLSEGGLAVALSECIIGGERGADIDLDDTIKQAQQDAEEYQAPPNSKRLIHRIDTILFGEGPSRIIVSVPANKQKQWENLWTELPVVQIGVVTEKPNLVIKTAESADGPTKTLLDIAGKELEQAWKKALPFN